MMRITHVCIPPHLVVEALTEWKALTDEHRTTYHRRRISLTRGYAYAADTTYRDSEHLRL